MIGHCVSNSESGGLELIILTEYMARGSLADVLEKDRDLSYRRRLGLILDVASGLARMHEKNFMHRDLRPDNILVDANYKAKIGDMGIAKRLESEDANIDHTLIGCQAYMPAEFYTQKYSKKLDIYTFGLTLNEVFQGEHEEKKQVITITKKASLFTYFVEWCTNKDPETRPDAKRIEKDLKFFYFIANGLVKKYFNEYVGLDLTRKNKFFEIGYNSAFQHYMENMAIEEEENNDNLPNRKEQKLPQNPPTNRVFEKPFEPNNSPKVQKVILVKNLQKPPELQRADVVQQSIDSSSSSDDEKYQVKIPVKEKKSKCIIQ